MSARDDMARIIQMSCSTRMKPETAVHYADNLVAAGYSKPRTITTAEELDGLPVGSVVLHRGRAFQHYPAHPAPFDEYQKWKCGDGGFVRSTKSGDMILPATVLHDPEAQQ